MKKTKKISKWPFVVGIIAFLFLLAFLFAGFISLFALGVNDYSNNVAVIPIKGVIVTEGSKDILGTSVTSSTETIKLIEKAVKNPAIKAIVFEINSPGGSAVASEEIGNAIKKVNKTKIAWIREMGASGGYWIASASDYIIANRMSFTGSIGVVGSYLEFGNFLADHNITYRRLTAGKYKDIGSPLREMTQSEEILFKKMLDDIHEMFLDEVTNNRKLTQQQRMKISDARFYLGQESKELGLIDELGDRSIVIKYLEKELNTSVKMVEYKNKKSFLDVLSETFSYQSFFVGKGLGSSIFDQKKLGNKLDIFV